MTPDAQMFLFLRCLLAHFIGDFPFQTNEIYRLKTLSIWGQFLHGQIVAATMLVVGWPYLGDIRFWAFAGFIAITHGTQDELKVAKLNKIMGQFWPFLIDQAIHVLLIAVLFLIPFGPPPPPIQHPLLSWYWNDHIIIAGIGLLASSFMGIYLLEAFRLSHFSQKERFTSGGLRDRFGVNYGMVERGLITAAMAFCPVGFLAAPAILLPRLCVKRLRYTVDALLNLWYAGLIGFVLRLFW